MRGLLLAAALLATPAAAQTDLLAAYATPQTLVTLPAIASVPAASARRRMNGLFTGVFSCLLFGSGQNRWLNLIVLPGGT